MAMTPAQQLAEVKRKAALGIALTNSTADKQAVYDQTRKQTDNEVMRKAFAGEALTSNDSAYNNNLYNSIVSARAAGGGGGQQQSSPTSLVDQLAEARRSQAIAALDKSKNAALSNLNAEKATIAPRYYEARNQTAAGSQQAARNFSEYFAARGGASSGAAAQAELSRNSSLQGNLGALRQQETQAFADIARRTSDVENAYQSDLVSANAGIEADRMNALLNDHYQQQQRELQLADLLGAYRGQSTLAAQSQQFNQGMANKQFDRGVLESDRSFERGVLESDRAFEYTQGRDKVADDQWMQEFNYRSQQDGIQNALAWAAQNLNERQESRIASNQSSGGSGGSGGSSKPSTNAVITDVNLPRTSSSMETWLLNNLPGGTKVAGPVIDVSKDGTITPSQLLWIETQILENRNLSDADRAKLYQRFGIPLE